MSIHIGLVCGEGKIYAHRDKMKLSTTLLVFFSCIGYSQQLFWGKTCPHGWDKLTTTFMKFHDVPMTESDAISEGWTKTDSKACDGHGSFVGNRYKYGNEVGRMALYDKNGVIAGIQSALGSATIFPKKYQQMFPMEDGKYLLTAYFTHPKSICSNTQTPSGCVGNQLYIQTGAAPQTLYKVPLLESAMPHTNWTKGKCFYQMGNHYWYDVSTNMDCDNFFPVFLLYNGGKLNAFGWALGGDAQDPNFEHPEKPYLGYFFQPETQPICLGTFSMRSTLHIYFQSGTLKYFC